MASVKLKGIDVSSYQGDIDWQKVKASGIQFAIIQTCSGNSVISTFKQHIEGALKAGIHVGCYHFSYAVDAITAKGEAELFYKTIKPYLGKIDMPLCFDYEDDSVAYAKRKYGRTITKTQATEIAETWLSYVESKKCYVVNYTNQNFYNNYFDKDKLSKYDIWYAAPDRSEPNITCGMMQYSWKGRVSGINGDVDLNYAYYDYPSVIKNAGLNGFPLDIPVKILGDINEDGKLTIKDVTLLQKIIAKVLILPPEKFNQADFNGDGSINIKDVTAIQKKIAKIGVDIGIKDATAMQKKIG